MSTPNDTAPVDLSTLPKRMRYAAGILEEANTRNSYLIFHFTMWAPDGLRDTADRWEAQDAESSVSSIDVLEQELRGDSPRTFRQIAEDLIDSGWGKGGTS